MSFKAERVSLRIKKTMGSRRFERPTFAVESVKQTSIGKWPRSKKVASRLLVRIAVFATLMHVRLNPLDNSSQLLSCTVR